MVPALRPYNHVVPLTSAEVRFGRYTSVLSSVKLKALIILTEVMSETKLKINSRFAQIYDKYRQKEELQRRKSYSLSRKKIFAVYFYIELK